MALDIASIIGGTVGDTFTKIVGAFKENPETKAQLQSAIDTHAAEFKLAELEMAGKMQDAINAQVLAQIAVNEQDAKGNWFQSSWRPLVGYICCLGLFYQIFLRPIINFGAQLLHSAAIAEPLDMGTLLTLLFGILGLGAYRMNEKLKDKD